MAKTPKKKQKTWRERGRAAYDTFFGTWTRVAVVLGVFITLSGVATAYDNLSTRFGPYAPATRGWVVIHVKDVRTVMDSVRTEQLLSRIQRADSEIERLLADQVQVKVKLREPGVTPEQIDILSKRLVDIGVSMAKAQALRSKNRDDCKAISACAAELDD